jgi:multidrug efflux pump subunit AcrB
VRVKLLQTGPPVQYPVQFRIIGPDPAVLKAQAIQLRDLMLADADLRGINDNWNEAVLQMRLEVDEDQARALGVTRQAIVQATRTLLSGTRVAEYREEDRLIEVLLRQPAAERQGIDDLTQTYVLSAAGKAIPLAQLVRVSQHWEPGVMWREARQFAVTVNADVRDGVQGPSVTKRLWPKVQALQAKMPAGYRVEIAGAAEQSGKGQGAILAGLPIMLFLIVTLLMLQLHSLSRTVLVLLTGPLGISGIAAALLLLNRPFGFVALLGVVALMGMIMRNSVILIDQIEHERARGVPAWDAVVESAVRRFRPIVLTAAAAVLAMIPLSRSVFWGPMAVAIMGGLIVATALTLLGLPAMYAAWFKVRREPSPAAR